MPFILVKTTEKISKEQEISIKSKLGKAAGIIGKPESYLMVGIEDDVKLYFRGSNVEPIAFVQVNLYGSVNEKNSNEMTACITKIINEELGISPNQIYVMYNTTNFWGLGGSNF
jgi:phenylpyruvate tautomerase PptA (4-oxalocrotonate tautomerase family)